LLQLFVATATIPIDTQSPIPHYLIHPTTNTKVYLQVMTLRRLRPITYIRIIDSKCPTYPRAHFSTVCPRLIQHPAPSRARFLPRILDPAVWFPFYKTEGKKRKAGPEEKIPKIHNPATFFVVGLALLRENMTSGLIGGCRSWQCSSVRKEFK